MRPSNRHIAIFIPILVVSLAVALYAAVPGAPTAVTGISGDTQVTVSWTAPVSNGGNPITGYRVRQATTVDGTYSNVAGCAPTPNTTPTCTATGLTNGQQYFFKVAAINASGTGANSDASAGVTPATTPNAPASVTASPGNLSVNLAWTVPTDDGGAAITGYRVQSKDNTAATAYANTACPSNSTVTSCSVTGLTNGHEYQFRVAGINAAGRGTFQASDIVISGTPTAPTGLVLTSGAGQVSVQWTLPSSNASPITSYQVQRATSEAGPYVDACAASNPFTSCVATALTNGQIYFFKVAAKNAIGTGPYSDSSSMTPGIPGTPTGVSAVPGNGQVSISWIVPNINGASDISGYQVQKATTVTGPYSNAAGCATNVTATSCTATGLTNGQQYFFKVAAINTAGTGAYSTATDGVVAGAPVVPSGFTGTPASSGASLSWTAPSDNGSAITGYQVQRATTLNGSYINATGCAANSTTPSCTATGLTNGTSYFFKVAAINARGTGPYSEVLVLTAGAPAAPGNLAGIPQVGSVDLSWTTPAGNGTAAISSYQVQKSTTGIAGSFSTACSATPPATSCTASSLGIGTPYFFQVAAINSAGTGPYSSPLISVTPGTPGAPAKPTGTSTTGGVRLSWVAPANTGASSISGYSIQWGTNAAGPFPFTTFRGGASPPSVSIGGLTNGTTYYFRLAASNSQGIGLYSVASDGIIPGAPDVAPTNLSGISGNGQVALSWLVPAVTGLPVSSYRVERSTTYSGPWEPNACSPNPTGTSCTAAGLTNGAYYYFRVAAANVAGVGPFSDNPIFIVVGIPSVPGTPTGAPGNTQVQLSWAAATDNGSAIQGYSVEKSTSVNGFYDSVSGCQSVATTTCLATGLSNGVTYYFRVFAFNSRGQGPNSPPSAGITLAPTVPGQPVNVTGTPGNAQITFSWAAPPNDGGSPISSYQPQIATSVGGPYSNACSASAATTCVVLNLTNGTPYFFQVAATNSLGQGAYSSPISVTPSSTANVPTAPTNVTGVRGSTQVTVSWTAPSSNGGSAITGYQVQRAATTDGVYANATGCLTNSTATSCVASGLTNGTAYTFKVAAINANGLSPYSTASGSVTPVGLPGAPVNVSVTNASTPPSTGRVLVAWDPPADTGGLITSYQVQGATSVEGPFESVCSLTATTSCTTFNIGVGSVWYFKVYATTLAGDGPFSALSAGITPAVAPDPPTNATVTPGNAQVTVQWSAPGNNGGSAVTGYQVQFAPPPYDSFGNAPGCPSNSVSTTCTIGGLTNGTSYVFRVAAINAVGSSEYLNANGAGTPATVPGTPTSLTGIAGASQIALQWIAPSSDGGAAIYEYQVKTASAANGTFGDPVCLSAITSCTLTLSNGLTAGTPYFFKVAATNTIGTGALSSASNAVTITGVPGVPTNVTGVQAGIGQVALSWTAPANDGGAPITGYVVFDSSSGQPASGCPTNSTNTACTVTGLTGLSAHSFYVAAVNSVGQGTDSALSNSVTPLQAPLLDALDYTFPAHPGTAVVVYMSGYAFVTGATSISVSGSGVTVSNVQVSSPYNLSATFTVSPSATGGFRDVTVTTAGGTTAAKSFLIYQDVSISGTKVSEGNSGQKNATFTVTLAGPFASAFSMDYHTDDGTASAARPNPSPIAILDNTIASPYPSTITVPSGFGLLTKVRVSLQGFSHPHSSEVGILLVGPGGQKVVLMNRAAASGSTITFDDDALSSIGDESGPGNYRPANLNTGDTWSAPAPAGPYATTLSAFIGTNPTGTWSLYVLDRSISDAGAISGGWSLELGSTPQTGVDYVATSGTLTFAAGETSKTVDVPIVGDTAFEGDETFAFSLSNPRFGATSLGTTLPSVTGFILDDDAPGAISIADTTATEGNSGTTNASFAVTLSAVAASTVSVDYQTDGRSAVGGLVNAAAIAIPESGAAAPYPSTITVPAGLGTLTKVRVKLLGFTHSCPTKVSALLVGPGGQSTILMSYADTCDAVNDLTLTIDDSGADMRGPLSSRTYTPSDYGPGDVWPGPAPSGPYGASLSVFAGTDPAGVWQLYVVAPNSALPGSGTIAGGWILELGKTVAGADYVPVSGTVTFAPGETSKTINVPIVGDSVPESEETFLVRLSNPTNALLARGIATGTILDNDVVQGISIAGATIPEGNSGTSPVAFAVSLSSPSVQTVTVDYRTEDNSAFGATKANTTALTIPSAGTASAYPSSITIPAGSAPVTKIRVKLYGFTHTYPKDVHVLLAGPGNKAVVLLTKPDAGAVSNLNLTFESDAPPLAPGALVSGSYSPMGPGLHESWPSPADSYIVNADLSVFTGTDPAGTWKLFIYDDSLGDSGSLSGGWSLELYPAPSGGDYDYVPASGTVTFAPGETSKNINVSIVGDTAVEATETFLIRLSNPVNAQIVQGVGTGTIVNDDGGVGQRRRGQVTSQ